MADLKWIYGWTRFFPRPRTCAPGWQVRRLIAGFVLGVLCAAGLPAAADAGSDLVRVAGRIAQALERANTLTERGCR